MDHKVKITVNDSFTVNISLCVSCNATQCLHSFPPVFGRVVQQKPIQSECVQDVGGFVENTGGFAENTKAVQNEPILHEPWPVQKNGDVIQKTMVLMADGSYQKINKLQPFDVVMSYPLVHGYNLSTGTIHCRVENVQECEKELYKLLINGVGHILADGQSLLVEDPFTHVITMMPIQEYMNKSAKQKKRVKAVRVPINDYCMLRSGPGEEEAMIMGVDNALVDAVPSTIKTSPINIRRCWLMGRLQSLGVIEPFQNHQSICLYIFQEQSEFVDLVRSLGIVVKTRTGPALRIYGNELNKLPWTDADYKCNFGTERSSSNFRVLALGVGKITGFIVHNHHQFVTKEGFVLSDFF